jgi:hypothetical protein
MPMELFVDREEEMKTIDNALGILQGEEGKLLKKPIIEFYGVHGIGKTMLLRNIEAYCQRERLQAFWSDPDQPAWFHFVGRAEDLVRSEPVVVILDALDTCSPEVMQEMIRTLRRLTDDSLFCVIIATRKKLEFKNVRPLARKTDIYLLGALEREYRIKYLEQFGENISEEVKDVICEWSGGYPLAMKVMAEAALEKQLDLTVEGDRKWLMDQLTEKVIKQGLLAAATGSDLRRYLEMFLLFAVPRRLYLRLMQKLIEEYLPEYKLKSPIAYMSLPPSLKKITDGVGWNIEDSEHVMHEYIRNLFLAKIKLEQPERHIAIHKFLAHCNKEFGQGKFGKNRIDYFCEHLYHLAHCEVAENLPGAIISSFEEMIRHEGEASAPQVDQEDFSDEEIVGILQDKNLLKILGENSVLLEHLVNEYVAVRHSRP